MGRNLLHIQASISLLIKVSVSALVRSFGRSRIFCTRLENLDGLRE